MKPIESIIRSNEPQPLCAPAKAACQGVAGAFSHQACLAVFDQPEIQFFPHFEDVFQTVSSGACHYGIIPIENTLAGSVSDNYDLMLQYHLHIVGTVTVKIEHSLLTLPDACEQELREVYSHDQALHQCSDFLKAHPQLTPHPYSNTAASAQLVAERQDPSLAAIGSPECARLYGLKVLHRSIQNRRDNFTRFVVLAKHPVTHPGCDRISLIVRVQHQAGALYRALSRFANQDINLLKLESRPIPDREFEFMFYFDLETSIYSAEFIQLMCELDELCEEFKYLGSYTEVV